MLPFLSWSSNSLQAYFLFSLRLLLFFSLFFSYLLRLYVFPHLTQIQIFLSPSFTFFQSKYSSLPIPSLILLYVGKYVDLSFLDQSSCSSCSIPIFNPLYILSPVISVSQSNIFVGISGSPYSSYLGLFLFLIFQIISFVHTFGHLLTSMSFCEVDLYIYENTL